MKPIPIELDKERNLLLDLNAMAEFEDLTNKNLFNLGTDFSASDVRALLWACLVHEDEGLTLRDVGGMIGPGNMEYIVQKLEQVYSTQLPQDKGQSQPKNAEGAAGQQGS